MSSFLAVTGPKTDLWLVQAFGMLVLAQGIVLLTLPMRRTIDVSLVAFGLASSATLAFVDAYFVFANVISSVYLLDGAFELGVAVLWIVALPAVLGGAEGQRESANRKVSSTGSPP
jgi:hypothetical protein